VSQLSQRGQVGRNNATTNSSGSSDDKISEYKTASQAAHTMIVIVNAEGVDARARARLTSRGGSQKGVGPSRSGCISVSGAGVRDVG